MSLLWCHCQPCEVLSLILIVIPCFPVQLTADCVRQTVHVKQLGNNPSSVGDKELQPGHEASLSDGDTLFVLTARFPNTVTFKQRHTSKNNSNKHAQESHNSAKRKLHEGNGDRLQKKPKTEHDHDNGRGSSMTNKHKNIHGSEKSGSDSDSGHVADIAEKLKMMRKNMKDVSADAKTADSRGESRKGEAQREGEERGREETRGEERGGVTKEAVWHETNKLLVYTSKGVQAGSKVIYSGVSYQLLLVQPILMIPVAPTMTCPILWYSLSSKVHFWGKYLKKKCIKNISWYY